MNSQNELRKKLNNKVLIDPHYNVSESLYNEMWNLVGEKLSSWVWEQLWYETRGFSIQLRQMNLPVEQVQKFFRIKEDYREDEDYA